MMAIHIAFQLFLMASDISLAICVVVGNLAIAKPSVIVNILGNTNKNNANTAMIATIKRMIGYINAQIYLFLMSWRYVYSLANDSNTILRFPLVSHALVIL